jgi:hypothetical protein
MSLDLVKYTAEILEFLTTETLEAIDWGVLDLGHVKDLELKSVLMVFEESLTLELKDNYKNNSTGIFRVRYTNGFWCYEEFGYKITADNLEELKEIVIKENRIWYVFDEFSLRIWG